VQFDVLILGDIRFPGGTSTAMASEARALARAGYTVGILPVKGGVLNFPHPVNPALRALFDQDRITVVAPGVVPRARLCLLHHPQLFTDMPAEPIRVLADRFLLVVHHPPVDARGKPDYDWRTIDRTLRLMFGRVTWAPVGPKVRKAFRDIADGPDLTSEDWVNVLDPEDFRLARAGFLPAVPVIGRHARPDPLKWPDDKATFLDAYPARPDIRVRLMGCAAEQVAIVGRKPANWEVLPFNAEPVRRFLGSIDYYVHFHGSTWIEAFGRAILEAIASGAVAVLPEHFRDVFGDAAVYCSARGVAETVLALHRDPAAYARQSARGVAIIRERYGPDVAVARVRNLIGAPAPAPAPRGAARAAAPAKVLFLTSNGVGMGHLTRALAVARRLPATVRPVVVTLSKAFGVCAADGIEAEYLPYHKSVGMDYDRWQGFLAREMQEILDFHRPQVFVFDGNVPYPGLVAALAPRPGLWKVWERRAMWAPGAGAHHLAQEPAFDVVIEPGELAHAMDRGLTRDSRARTIPVPPSRYLRAGEGLDRAAARLELGLDMNATAVLLQLGSENNFDLSSVRHAAIKALGRHPQVSVVNAEWLIRNGVTEVPASVAVLRQFPIARYLAAFDFAISTAGYNTFHENIFGALPTIFVPNENPEQDEQWLRARHAALGGLGMSARIVDPYELAPKIERMMDPAFREGLAGACMALDPANGADEAARYLSELAMIRR
jgi:glycosyltransferase involved in cell wall biosynthesis